MARRRVAEKPGAAGSRVVVARCSPGSKVDEGACCCYPGGSKVADDPRWLLCVLLGGCQSSLLYLKPLQTTGKLWHVYKIRFKSKNSISPLGGFRSCRTKPGAHGRYLARHRYSFIPKSTRIASTSAEHSAKKAFAKFSCT
jgi:hypothetical protein